AGRPGVAEGTVAVTATLPAGPVAGRQPGRLVQEEQLGVVAGRHDPPPPVLELQEADEPPLHLPGADDLAPVVVKEPPVAHEGAWLGGGDDLAERRDAILPRHGHPS